jgi:nitrogen fixation NifU-like protein
MTDLRDLYQEVILDHNKRPRNFGALDDPSHAADGHNPLCGDRLHVSLVVDGETVRDVRFEGSGCAISTASASLMTEAVKGHTVEEAEKLFEGFHELLTGDPAELVEASTDLGKLAVFEGVREFPVRVKCATLAWHTLKAALDAESGATTE